MQIKSITLSLLLAFTLVACSAKIIPNENKDPVLESLKVVRIKIDDLPNLDLEEYRSIKFYEIKKPDGLVDFGLKEDDAKKLVVMLYELSSYIELQRNIISEIKKYYDGVVGNVGISGQEVDQRNSTSSGKIQMDVK